MEETIQTTFLVPVREDKDFGSGKKHSDWNWTHLEDELYERFGGWTRSNNLYPGGWVNPQSKMRIEDISRKYFVDLKRKDLGKLVSLLCRISCLFEQNCIRLESDGKVQYIERQA